MSRAAHLLGLMETFTPADALEARHAARIESLLLGPGDAFARGRFDPGHITASAFVWSPDRSSVLLIHHGKLHRWLQPGGHVDPDDVDVLAAARREVAEEVGIVDAEPVGSGLFDVDVHEIPALKGDPAHAHFDVRILLQARSLDAVAGSDARAARWVRLEDVNEVESDASVARAVAKLVARR